ncbi:MAG: hypothetical protein AAF388_08270 [Bacteroidota bacterium]
MMKTFGILGTFLLAGASLVAQKFQKCDTILTETEYSHQFLNLKVPGGEFAIQSSEVCGQSLYKVVSDKEGPSSDISSKSDNKGNVFYTFQTVTSSQQLTPKSVSTASMTQRVASRLAGWGDTEPEETKLKTLFHPDPSFPTDLRLDLVSGKSDLDLSGLTLRNLSVNSATTDVLINYSQPNTILMNKMDVHAIRGDILIKNIEMAKAEVVNIKNDMGETKVVLGNNCAPAPGANVVISSGVGNCNLVISKNHPAKILVHKGFFSSTSMSEQFEKVRDGVFVNSAYKRNPKKGTTIICNLDFGKVFVSDL